MEQEMHEKDSVRAVERALSLLEFFDFNSRTLTLNQLMELSGLPKTTVVRLISSLENRGFLIKDPDGVGYRLGLVLFRLGHVVEVDMELTSIARPTLRECAQKTRESVEINVVMDDHRVCIAKIDSDRTLRYVIPLGKNLPLYRGGSGKLLLAYLPREKQEQILKENELSLGKSPSEVLDELDQIKAKGYSVSISDRLIGAIAISAPVRDSSGTVIAGLTISGAAARYSESEIQEVLAEVVRGAKKISMEMGYEDHGE